MQKPAIPKLCCVISIIPWLIHQSTKFPSRHLIILNIVCICLCLSVITCSVLLKPSVDGFRTHESLGLPSCLTSKLLGIDRCPSCGLTTSFALVAKGRIHKAILVHPWGVPFYCLVIIFLVTSLTSLIKPDVKIWIIPILMMITLGLIYFIWWIKEIVEIMR